MTPLEARLAALAAAGETITYGALDRDLGLRMADLTAQSEDRAIDQPMLFLDVRTERAHRVAYRIGFACLVLALAASWLSTRL